MLQFHLILTLILIVVLMGAVQGTCAYLILLERKISAWAQDRIGPNRVGPFGLLQPIADGAKFLLKEEMIPKHVDKLFFMLAPAIAISTSTLAIAVVPFGDTPVPPTRPWAQTVEEEDQFDKQHPEFQQQVKAYNESIPFVIVPHVNIGLVYVFAVGSLAAYGIVLAGWSSNNKYSFLGALRSSAQLISYEIPMGMSIIGVVLLAGSLDIERIIVAQYYGGWNILFQPLACLLFVTSIFAECNRLPFDLAEAEQELVGGYHTEYSGLKFGLFFLGEYTHMITTSFLASALFFGGWLFPWLATPEMTGVGGMIIKLIVFGVKMGLFICFFMLIRWTIPRFRYDQLMELAWKVLIPLALVNVVAVMVVKQFLVESLGQPALWLLLPLSLAILAGATAITVYWPTTPQRKTVYFRGLGTWR
jgi:NADH-quinone oxidoreductase subunit H